MRGTRLATIKVVGSKAVSSAQQGSRLLLDWQLKVVQVCPSSHLELISQFP